jgi:hypothetical protein
MISFEISRFLILSYRIEKRRNMMKGKAWRERALFLAIGIMTALALVALTGASDMQPVGRYQMDSVLRGNFTDIYVIDTTTGAVKWVGNDEGKAFESIRDR